MAFSVPGSKSGSITCGRAGDDDRMGPARLSESFCSLYGCILIHVVSGWKFYTYHRWRENPGRSSGNPGWMVGESIFPVRSGYQAPLCWGWRRRDPGPSSNYPPGLGENENVLTSFVELSVTCNLSPSLINFIVFFFLSSPPSPPPPPPPSSSSFYHYNNILLVIIKYSVQIFLVLSLNLF